MDSGNQNKEKVCEVAGWSSDISLNKIEGHKKLMRDCFLSSCTFPSFFLAMLPHDRTTVFSDMEANKPFFQQWRKVVYVLGFSCYQKVTKALRMIDGAFLQMHECTKVYAETMVRIYEEQYMRAPNAEDRTRLLAHSEARGWPRILWSVGSMQ
jgi:hypothetical protein